MNLLPNTTLVWLVAVFSVFLTSCKGDKHKDDRKSLIDWAETNCEIYLRSVLEPKLGRLIFLDPRDGSDGDEFYFAWKSGAISGLRGSTGAVCVGHFSSREFTWVYSEFEEYIKKPTKF